MGAHLFYNLTAVPHLVFRSFFLPKFFHGIFTCHGGVSKGPWQSLNVSFNVGDTVQNVLENRQRVKSAFGVSWLVSAAQVHGDKVFVLGEDPLQDLEAEGYDAIITAVRGIALMIQQADCQAVLLYDPIKHVVGIAHVGWRGSVANIIDTTVTAMGKNFDVSPSNLHAAVSPSLGPCCAQFMNYQHELPRAFQSYLVGDDHFNFWSISKSQLVDAGIKAQNIHIAEICTVCNSDFFSYRRENITGRFASIIGLYS